MRAYRVRTEEYGPGGYWVLRDEFGITVRDRNCNLCGTWLTPGSEIRRLVMKIDGELIQLHIGVCCYGTYR